MSMETKEDRVTRPGKTEGKKPKLTWSRACWDKNIDWKRECMAALRSYMAAGTSDADIIKKTGATYRAVEYLKEEIYTQETKQLEGTEPVAVFIQYCIQQEGCIKELDECINKFKKTNQGSAVVGAIKEKSSIYERVIKMGQELGVLEKAADKLMVVAGVQLAGKTPQEIKALIEDQLDEIKALTGIIGSGRKKMLFETDPFEHNQPN